MIARLQAFFADVRLQSARGHAVGDEVLTFELLAAQTARIQWLAAFRVIFRVQAHFQSQIQRLPADNARERRCLMAVRLQVRIKILFTLNYPVARCTLSGADHFTMSQLVLGQHARRAEHLIADVALETAAEQSAGRRMMMTLHVRF